MEHTKSITSRRSVGRRGSGLLLKAPEDKNEKDILRESLTKLTSVTRAITANIRIINGNLDRILEDKTDIEEIEQMLMQLSKQHKEWNK